MGFVVQGGGAEGTDARWPTGTGFLSALHGDVDLAAPRSVGWSSRLSLGDGAASVPTGPFSAHASFGPPTLRVLTPPNAGTALDVWARQALARAGRHAAPATAPPVRTL